ncbi:hypothetical protein MXD62_03775 [Frankia sp. Mgl5]|uniref:hypothetical protein n=1 Tax=Frankia sp. Mgl5 TaxID=2933793 RepID=UPI00200F7B9C|nr:hypothetical protein [Frankia sp. Mgl5]MCK9926294.1 hypothetical protein [Frankia sp. Mgl5]
MLLHDSESEARFRKEIRAWARAAVPRLGPPPPGRDWAARRSYDSAWQRMPADASGVVVDEPAGTGDGHPGGPGAARAVADSLWSA